jgi:AcrR family transcriptional regulator
MTGPPPTPTAPRGRDAMTALLQNGRRPVPDMTARILDAAAALYLERGRTETTLSAIAQRAGVSRPSVYKHLGDADGVAHALIDRELARFFERIGEVLLARPTLRDRLVEGLAFTVEYARGHVLLQRMLELEPDLVVTAFTLRGGDVLRRAVDLLAPELERATDHGEVVGIAPDVAAEWVARIAVSLVLTPSVTRDLEDPEELRRYLESLLVGGLVTREPSRSR